MLSLCDKLYQQLNVKDLLEDPLGDLEELRAVLQEVSEVNAYYVRQFLSARLVDQCDEDWVYEMYVDLLSSRPLRPDEPNVLVYRLGDTVRVSIREMPRLISAVNTTGFRTWRAATSLSKLLVEHRELTRGKTVLELGCGTGLSSITVGVLDEYKKLYVTDGDTGILSEVTTPNLSLNKVERDVQCQRLVWASEDRVPGDIDVVVGADITYDPTVFPELCTCLDECLQQPKCQCAILACTERNRETVHELHSQCAQHSLSMECLQAEDAVKIYKITRRPAAPSA
ncbi:protein-lysine N-methyltransferase KNAG_0B06720 [Huiozyma naganishii CBS 8797]|uniref:FAM86 N-terminal domain-containing protein n=1 Tax=Huiozyma naganishii (strain ATCC MYA-139 / BCRC 22969 / CBS 8797 / KCTC 17520 / NBRC 10181 / NCYC 3082 / Yp74L-3) TaxID=1071383 RepID=J7RVW4_HUIN7|nr:hypothetical protein KNAG_0B06720 [Kazachstania naganishii CBS 8797]CCK69097.1 hypothetical protein KNAG_0B06720 [Kazachstania naganishii CBS 8797]